jgi:hypothetical protein
MADFHRKVEEQLRLLNSFWEKEENKTSKWDSNAILQAKYYDYLLENGFVTGNIENNKSKKAKTARQKTSGLVQFGLINNNRRLTAVGDKLVNISIKGNFKADNKFQLPSDSFIYFKQLLKTSSVSEDGVVRPYLIIGKVLSACDDYLTENEYTFLLPLCVNEETTKKIIEQIALYRNDEKKIDDIIVEIVLQKYDYPAALDFFISAEKTPENIMKIGLNRDGKKHDRCYVKLYECLKDTYLRHREHSVPRLMEAAKLINNKPGNLWRNLLFKNARRHDTVLDLKPNEFDDIETEEKFDQCFFKYLHLIKIKTNLQDYRDLNRRYLQTSDTVQFDDGKLMFTPLFKNFFKTPASAVFDDAFTDCRLLETDCDLQQIHKKLVFVDDNVIDVFNKENNTTVDSMKGLYDYIENERYRKFRELIDKRFSDTVLLSMLDKFERRNNDAKLISIAGGEADVPTIFEYVVGIIWYRLSDYKGKILEYMNLSLGANLLPRTHAGGGESDIVYKYNNSNYYPQHTLLIECTLMEGTTQRRGEMEPVSRHLANYMIDEDQNAYCVFVSNKLHASVISDFRGRKNLCYYRNDTEYVEGMKIIPIEIKDIKLIVEKRMYYSQLYKLFDVAFFATDVAAPPLWYKKYIANEIANCPMGE